jgi:hypothetical protein
MNNKRLVHVMTRDNKHTHSKLAILNMRQMNDEDFKTVRNWCVKENWNLGSYDSSIYLYTDPGAHFIFFDNETPVGSISLTKHDDSLFTVGPFIVNAEYRGKGHGRTIWSMAMRRMTRYPNASILLYSVIDQVNLYQSYGFKPQYKNIRWNLSGGTQHVHQTVQCEPLTPEILYEIIKYDRKIFAASREKILCASQNYSDIKGFFVKVDNQIKGYGLIRPCISGLRIGPLFADNLEIAKCILAALLERAGSESVIIDMPEVNDTGRDLMLIFNANRDEIFDTVVMLKGGFFSENELDMRKNYGIFSLEIG